MEEKDIFEACERRDGSSLTEVEVGPWEVEAEARNVYVMRAIYKCRAKVVYERQEIFRPRRA